ncbi:MAG: heme exporter protein CcmB [Hyphomicrobiales bacterium]
MFTAIIARDIRLILRQGGGAGMSLGFVLTVIVMIPLGIGPDHEVLSQIAPGIMWIALLLSVLLSADRIFRADYEDGSLELMGLGVLPLELVVLAKAVVHWLTSALPLSLTTPLFGIFLNLDPSLFSTLGLAMITGSATLSLMGCVGGAVTLGLRRGGLVISILILPLYVPILVFGLSASVGSMGADHVFNTSFLMLIAFALASVVLCPVAAAGILRAHFR